MRVRLFVLLPFLAAACASSAGPPAAGDVSVVDQGQRDRAVAAAEATAPRIATTVAAAPVMAQPVIAAPVAEKPAVVEPAPTDASAACTPAAEAPSATAKPAASGEKGDGAYPGFRVPAFKASVRRPGAAAADLDSRAAAKPTLYIINSTSCPYCTAYVDRIKTLEKTYMAKGVDVVHVYPNRKETDADKLAWHTAQGFAGGQILDAGAVIAKGLEADKTPTAYVVDTGGKIVYRGAIDSAAYAKMGQVPYLANALDALLEKRPIENDTTEPAG